MNSSSQREQTAPKQTLAVPTVSRSYSQQSTRSEATLNPPHIKNEKSRKLALRRRIIGLVLLAGVVILWTASGFLQSSIYADSTYSHPYFVTYFDTSCFIIPFLPYALKQLAPARTKSWLEKHTASKTSKVGYKPLETVHSHESNHLDPWNGTTPILRASQDGSHDTLAENPKHLDGTVSPVYHSSDDVESVNDLTLSPTTSPISSTALPPLTMRETFYLSLRFALLWFAANYMNSACLHFTTVASVTILSSTSSIFTLIFGSLVGVEAFTWRKALGVAACLTGVILTSGVDVSSSTGNDDESRGSFPSKTRRELAIGDALALAAAMLYGLYSVALVKTVGDESRIKMPVFFGFLGLINVGVLWPGFFLLDTLDVEEFSLPPNAHIWGIIIVNALSSLVSDVCWAYAMLYTSPLVVTVGLSLTIPLSLVGQMVLNEEFASPLYWGGAAIVVVSFIFVNNEHASKSVQQVEGDGEEDGER